jgi:hypothetical protein
MTIIRVLETRETPYYDADLESVEVDVLANVFIVDVDKILAAWESRDELRTFQLGYVEHIVDAALAGKSFMSTSEKYSFGDEPLWYTAILADEGAVPDLTIEVQVV